MKSKRTKTIRNSSGQTMLIAVIFFLVVSMVIVTSVYQIVFGDYKNASTLLSSKESYFLSEAAAEDVTYRLTNGITVSSEETISIGGNSATATVTNDSSGKIITSVGNKRNNIRKVQTRVGVGAGIAFNYGIQAGNGGFELENNAGVYGNVYANGHITGSNTSFVTGSAVAASTVSILSNQSNMLPDIPADSIIFGDTNSKQDFAQSFEVTLDLPINKIVLKIKKIGSPPSASVRIVEDSSGSPGTNNILSSNGTLNSNHVSSTFGNVDIVLPSNPTLVSGTKYWFVVDLPSKNASNYYVMAANTDYSEGEAEAGKYGGTWITSGLDGYFEIYLGGLVSEILDMNIGENGIGDAWAHTINNSVVAGTLYCDTGSGNSGACDPSLGDPAPEVFPVSDANINAWKNAAEQGGIVAGNYTPSGSVSSLGPVKIDGDLIIPGNHELTLTGAVWVTGNITMSNNSAARLSASFGNSGGVLVSDGRIYLDNNVDFYGSGAADSYILLLTTSDCPTGAGCGGESAIVLNNNVGADSNQVIVNAQKGRVEFFNNADVKSVAGEIVYLNNNAMIHYDSGLANVIFSSGPSGGYSIESWKEIE